MYFAEKNTKYYRCTSSNFTYHRQLRKMSINMSCPRPRAFFSRYTKVSIFSSSGEMPSWCYLHLQWVITKPGLVNGELRLTKSCPRRSHNTYCTGNWGFGKLESDQLWILLCSDHVSLESFSASIHVVICLQPTYDLELYWALDTKAKPLQSAIGCRPDKCEQNNRLDNNKNFLVLELLLYANCMCHYKFLKILQGRCQTANAAILWSTYQKYKIRQHTNASITTFLNDGYVKLQSIMCIVQPAEANMQTGIFI